MTRTPLEAANLEVMRKMGEAFNRRNLDEIMPLFAVDAVYEDYMGVAPAGNRYSGIASIRSVFAQQFAENPNSYFEEFIPVASDRWGALEYTIVLSRTPELRCRLCDFFEFRDGKVVRKSTWVKQIG